MTRFWIWMLYNCIQDDEGDWEREWVMGNAQYQQRTTLPLGVSRKTRALLQFKEVSPEFWRIVGAIAEIKVELGFTSFTLPN